MFRSTNLTVSDLTRPSSPRKLCQHMVMIITHSANIKQVQGTKHSDATETTKNLNKQTTWYLIKSRRYSADKHSWYLQLLFDMKHSAMRRFKRIYLLCINISIYLSEMKCRTVLRSSFGFLPLIKTRSSLKYTFQHPVKILWLSNISNSPYYYSQLFIKMLPKITSPELITFTAWCVNSLKFMFMDIGLTLVTRWEVAYVQN